MAKENHLKSFIVEMCEVLREDEDIEIEEIHVTFQRFRHTLEHFYDPYEGACPEGTESLQIHMRNGITLFYGALEALEDYLEEPDKEYLEEALENAEQGGHHLDQASALVEMVTERESHSA